MLATITIIAEQGYAVPAPKAIKKEGTGQALDIDGLAKKCFFFF
jgi:hypothetical protein